MDYTQFAMFYAGAQKNLGPAGVTLVVIRDDFLATANKGLPTILSYKTHADSKSLYNTPPVFGVYMIKLVLEWIKSKGGLAGVEKLNDAKQSLLYGAIDAAPDFYKGAADKGSRSWLNVTMRLPSRCSRRSSSPTPRSVVLLGIKGHRSVGGIRFSVYNAVSIEIPEDRRVHERVPQPA
jgi:phosphoserine aminotransferase